MDLERVEKLYRYYYYKNLIVSKDEIRIPFLGMIYGNKYLFIGQNPGHPHSKKDLEHFKNIENSSYEEQQEIFKASWRTSQFVTFIAQVCNNINIDLYKECGVTNLVKYWTKGNAQPSSSNDDQKLLFCEIKLIKPEAVIFFSRYAFNSFKYLDRINTKVFVFNHPASCFYNKEYAKKVSETILNQNQESQRKAK